MGHTIQEEVVCRDPHTQRASEVTQLSRGPRTLLRPPSPEAATCALAGVQGCSRSNMGFLCLGTAFREGRGYCTLLS